MQNGELTVKKTVKVGDSLVKREGKVLFQYPSTIEEALDAFPEEVPAMILFALETRFRQKASNALNQAGAASKLVTKTLKLFKAVNPATTEQQVRALLMAQPEFREKLEKAGEVERNVTFDYTAEELKWDKSALEEEEKETEEEEETA